MNMIARAARSPAMRVSVSALLLCMLVACNVTGEKQPTLGQLSEQLNTLENELVATNAAVEQLGSRQAASNSNLAKQIDDVNAEVIAIPEAVSGICARRATVVPAPCPRLTPRTVVMTGDKMVVGELERVWIDPPGVFLVARIDTGAQSSSLHATNLVEFERDGESWVRFEVEFEDETKTMERRVTRYVRVYQQADPEGSRRPVVSLRLRLGDVQDTFEFTLADRAHLDQQMILGRSFLTDMALVDVGKRFVQPGSPSEN